MLYQPLASNLVSHWSFRAFFCWVTVISRQFTCKSEKMNPGSTCQGRSGIWVGFAFLKHFRLVSSSQRRCEAVITSLLFHDRTWWKPHSNDKLSKKQFICSSTAFYTGSSLCWGRCLPNVLFLTLSDFQMCYLLGDAPEEILSKLPCISAWWMQNPAAF